ncbi:MAG: hypothetical protein ACLRSY_02795 [Acutalibacter sp.]
MRPEISSMGMVDPEAWISSCLAGCDGRRGCPSQDALNGELP